ncbi:MAG: 6-carboxytetrahydropterin synthase [Lactobacillales bacterium]|jgi:6-pyruvoyltetrahydropterin/6-carboxytetrahydropterin synthase|nr:6-carboxytetrahydropterin synthase [Lactobacillales bacterium]
MGNLAAIESKFTFEMSHLLHWHEGQCSNLHGHTYVMYVEVERFNYSLHDRIVLDFKDLKSIVEELIEPFDHALTLEGVETAYVDLPTKKVLLGFSPSAENMAMLFATRVYSAVAGKLGKSAEFNIRVKLFETQRNCAKTAYGVDYPYDEETMKLLEAVNV